jgi:hypothetical protein
MIFDIDFPIETSTNKSIQKFLKFYGFPYSYSSKSTLMDKINTLKSIVNFTWRQDQLNVINSFIKQEYKYYVVNGIFGCGKTSMLMGIHIISILKNIYKPDEAMFISFNVSIKNELHQKLKNFGISSKTEVRTFDSIIYEICKNYEYPYLTLPNYEGKRKFVYSICKQIISEKMELKFVTGNPKFIFIDECQDLESQTMIIFTTFFPSAQVIFTGDVFQSIQKEPKESLLWELLNNPEKKINKYYMKETPRVPNNILCGIKTTLQDYYPEFRDEIENWKSSSLVDNEVAKIEWKTFNTYSSIFSRIDEFLETYEHSKSMILTFSSAITVKGAIGDLAKIRRHLLSNGVEMNKNYKKMDYDKLFLSTANSSKGLERDYVLIISTFPLERAFINFSNDLVMNLITVGITRAKQKVIFIVPTFCDKFSSTLNNFIECPKPTNNRIRNDTFLGDFDFWDYYNIEHSATEIINQNLVKYDTRIKIKEYTKQFNTLRLFDRNIPVPKIEIEEEKAFVGILIENLITSAWANKWPNIESVEKFKNHPMYCHCFKKLEKTYNKYISYIKKNSFNNLNDLSFNGIYLYSQIHLGMYNKIFMDLSPSTKEKLVNYWNILRPKILDIKPRGDIKIQVNMKMQFTTGICDVMMINKKDSEETKSEEITIWEIKASTEQDWKDNALFQAILYALMSGKNWCRIILLNPFRNEKCSYYFKMKDIMTLRQLVINDIISWNIGCYLAKNIKAKGNVLRVTNNYMLCMRENETKDKFLQMTLLQFISPTKFDIIYNYYTHDDSWNEIPRNELSTLKKLSRDSTISEKEALQLFYDFLTGPQTQGCKIYYCGDCEFEDKEKFIPISELNVDENFKLRERTEKEENETNKLMDVKDCLNNLLLKIGYLGKDFKLI